MLNFRTTKHNFSIFFEVKSRNYSFFYSFAMMEVITSKLKTTDNISKDTFTQVI